MAKKRKTKDLFPRKIAGVKVPKKVRQGRFGELLASPTGQALIAQAVVGAGAIAAGLKAKDNPKVRRVAHKAKQALTDTGGEAKDRAGDAGSNLAFALSEAARTFADALRGGEPRTFTSGDDHDGGDDQGAWSGHYGAPARSEGDGKKQPSAHGAQTP